MIGLAALCLALAVAVGLGILLVLRARGWRRRRIGMLVRPWLLAILLILTLGVAAAGSHGLDPTGAVEWSLFACWLTASLLLHLIDRRSTGTSDVTRRWGARLAHAGAVVAMGGVILSSLFTATSVRAMAPGDTVTFNGWAIQLHDVWPAAGQDWAGLSAELRASGGSGVILLQPKLRASSDGTTRPEAATVASGNGQLSAKVGPRDGDGKWPITLSWTPLLVLIPIGGLLAAIGIALAMIGPSIARARRLRQARLATAWWA
jgi:cytochrome c-type biogenesis protein CcmF